MKKLFALLLAVVLLMGAVPTVAFAAETSYSKADYQVVLDKLNALYGTKIRFATAEELQKIGFVPESIEISPAEFEKEMLNQIEVCEAANLEALAASERSRSMKVDESGSGICKPSRVVIQGSTYPYYDIRPVTGANVHLEAVVNNHNGYWQFSRIKDVMTTSTQSIPYPWFLANTYNHQFIDTRRTCALDLYGSTLDRYGAIVDPHAYRYVEFWAGTGMGTP